jgi:hypothetical protein
MFIFLLKPLLGIFSNVCRENFAEISFHSICRRDAFRFENQDWKLPQIDYVLMDECFAPMISAFKWRKSMALESEND